MTNWYSPYDKPDEAKKFLQKKLCPCEKEQYITDVDLDIQKFLKKSDFFELLIKYFDETFNFSVVCLEKLMKQYKYVISDQYHWDKTTDVPGLQEKSQIWLENLIKKDFKKYVDYYLIFFDNTKKDLSEIYEKCLLLSDKYYVKYAKYLIVFKFNGSIIKKITNKESFDKILSLYNIAYEKLQYPVILKFIGDLYRRIDPLTANRYYYKYYVLTNWVPELESDFSIRDQYENIIPIMKKVVELEEHVDKLNKEITELKYQPKQYLTCPTCETEIEIYEGGPEFKEAEISFKDKLLTK